jgi:hypothetical protein
MLNRMHAIHIFFHEKKMSKTVDIHFISSVSFLLCLKLFKCLSIYRFKSNHVLEINLTVMCFGFALINLEMQFNITLKQRMVFDMQSCHIWPDEKVPYLIKDKILFFYVSISVNLIQFIGNKDNCSVLLSIYKLHT